MNKRILYSLVGVMLLAMLGVVWVTYTETENTDEALAGPPQLVTDPGYGATLSGSPYYSVNKSEEDLFAMNSCNLTDDRQNGWYEVVALSDGATVRDTIFRQAKFKEGDLFVAVIWNAEDKTFESLPNKIFKASDGSALPLLSLDKTLKKGTVIALNSNRDVEYCADNYDDTAGHENIYKGWNLVSKPNFEKVNELAVWTVDFGQPGPEQKYPKLNSSDADTKDLSDDILYWVYGGSDAAGVTGGNNGGSQNGSDPEILLETLRTDGVAGTRVVNDNDELLLAEKQGAISMYVSLTSQPADNVELEFQLYENGSRVSNVAFAKEVAIRSSVGSSSFQTGQNFTTSNFSTKNNFVLVGIDDDKVEINNAEIRVVDKAGKIATRTFKIGIIDDDILNGGAVCTQQLVYGLILSIKDQAQNSINDALVVVTDASENEVERMTGTIGFSQYTLLAEKEGDYKVSISKTGYKPTSFDVTLEKDECHVITKAYTVNLELDNIDGGDDNQNNGNSNAGNNGNDNSNNGNSNIASGSIIDFINSGGFVGIGELAYIPGYDFGDYTVGEEDSSQKDSNDGVTIHDLKSLNLKKVFYDNIREFYWLVDYDNKVYKLQNDKVEEAQKINLRSIDDVDLIVNATESYLVYVNTQNVLSYVKSGETFEYKSMDEYSVVGDVDYVLENSMVYALYNGGDLAFSGSGIFGNLDSASCDPVSESNICDYWSYAQIDFSTNSPNGLSIPDRIYYDDVEAGINDVYFRQSSSSSLAKLDKSTFRPWLIKYYNDSRNETYALKARDFDVVNNGTFDNLFVVGVSGDNKDKFRFIGSDWVRRDSDGFYYVNDRSLTYVKLGQDHLLVSDVARSLDWGYFETYNYNSFGYVEFPDKSVYTLRCDRDLTDEFSGCKTRFVNGETALKDLYADLVTLDGKTKHAQIKSYNNISYATTYGEFYLYKLNADSSLEKLVNLNTPVQQLVYVGNGKAIVATRYVPGGVIENAKSAIYEIEL